MNKNVPVKMPKMCHMSDKSYERHPTWLELFYDLIFVAAVAQLASNLNKDYTWAGLFKFIVLFIPMWWAWAGYTYYLTRFDTDDKHRRIMTFLQIIAVTILIAHLPDGFDTNSKGFAISYGVVRFLLVIEYIRTGIYIIDARPLIIRYSTGFGIAAFLWFISAFIDLPYRYVFWAVALLIDFLTPFTAGKLHIKFPIHFGHLPERFGLLTLIVIGEAVVATVTGLESTNFGLYSSFGGIMGLIIAFTFWWGYYEDVKGAEMRKILSMEHVGKYQLWIYSHIPLVIAITAVSVGVRHIMVDALNILPSYETWIFCLSVFTVMISLLLLLVSSNTVSLSRDMIVYLIASISIALLCIVTALLAFTIPGLAVITLLAIFGIAQIIYNNLYWQRLEKKHSLSNKKHSKKH